jgi:hypothetical protein
LFDISPAIVKAKRYAMTQHVNREHVPILVQHCVEDLAALFRSDETIVAKLEHTD